MSDFKAKMHRSPISAEALSRPCWDSLQRFPEPLAGFKGLTSKQGSGNERMGRDGSGRKGRGGTGVLCSPKTLPYNTPWLRVQFHTASQVCCR